MRVMAAGARLTLRRALKVTFRQGVRTLRLCEFTPLWLLDRVAEPVADVLAAEVGQCGDAQDVGEPVEGLDQAVGTGAGGVVLAI